MNTFLGAERRRIAILVALALSLAFLSLLLFFVALKPASAGATVEIRAAWIRATPPGAQVGGAFVTFHNPSAKELVISGVQSDVSSTAEIHEMSMSNGLMRMRHIEGGLHIKPGETVALAPGGLHIMLMGLQRPLKAGETVKLKFAVSDGEEIKVSAPVRDDAP